MQLSIEQYQASKSFLLHFASLNISQQKCKVHKGIRGQIPTTIGYVKFKPNDTFIFNYKDGDIVSFTLDEQTYEPTWSQLKLNEWKDKNFRRIDPFNEK